MVTSGMSPTLEHEAISLVLGGGGGPPSDKIRTGPCGAGRPGRPGRPGRDPEQQDPHRPEHHYPPEPRRRTQTSHVWTHSVEYRRYNSRPRRKRGGDPAPRRAPSRDEEEAKESAAEVCRVEGRHSQGNEAARVALGEGPRPPQRKRACEPARRTGRDPERQDPHRPEQVGKDPNKWAKTRTRTAHPNRGGRPELATVIARGCR